MQFLILYVDRLIGKDIPLPIIIELILTNLAYMVVLAAPMAVLVSTLMAFGKFSELNELTALRSSGVNPLTIIRPVILASLVLAVFLVWFSNNVLPEANNKARSLFIDIRLKKPGFELQPNIFYNGIDGYTFLVDEINPETDSLYDVTLFQEPTNARDRAYIKSNRGFLKSEGTNGLSLILEDGEMIRFLTSKAGQGRQNQELTTFDRYRITFDLSDLEFSRSNPEQRSRSDRTMSAQAMSVVVDTLKKELEEYEIEVSEVSSYQSFYRTSEETQSATKNLFTLPIEVDTADVLPQTELLALQTLGTKEFRDRALRTSTTRLEEHKSKIENISSNMLWRLKRVNRYLVEIHKKFSIPFACIVFVLLGAPIGIMTRRGNFGYAAIISAVILTVYWISIIQGEKLADRLFITPFWGMWSFNVIFSMVGILLITHLMVDLSPTKLFSKRD